MNDELTASVRAEVLRLCDAHRDQPGALLPLLHAVQDAVGHVPPAALPLLAQALNLSIAEVHGVVSYYHAFRTAPPGRHVLQVCQAEACQACGAEALMAMAEHTLGCAAGQTGADGEFTLEPVYCLGLCAVAPAVQLDGQLHARMDAPALAQLLAARVARREAA